MLLVIGGIGGGAYFCCLRRRRKDKKVTSDEINMETPAIVEESNGFNGKLSYFKRRSQ